MKIAINTLGPSKLKAGIGNYVVHLVHELAKLDHKNEYIILANKDNAAHFNLAAKNFKTVILPAYTTIKPLRILWEQVRLPFLLKKIHVDLLHSPGFVTPFIKTTKSMVTIHDMTFFSHPEYHTRWKQMYFQRMIPKSVEHADAVIADSENTKQDLLKYVDIPASKITTIHLGTSTLFKKTNKQNAQKIIVTKYNIHLPFILFVGTIEPRKNLQRLVDAYTRCNHPSLKLVIVGQTGWKTKSLFSDIQEKQLSNRIIFPGFVPDEDLVLFYNAAEAFVYPSLYEGFGIPVIESMACGCPVVTSNNSSLVEIAHDAALLIDPLDIDALTQAINTILTNKKLREHLITAGLTRAKQYTWKKTAAKTLEVYRQVMQE